MFRKMFAVPMILLLALLFTVPAAVTSGPVSTAYAASTWTAQQETYMRTTLASRIGATTYIWGSPRTLGPDQILLESYEWGYQAINVSDFMIMFSDAFPDTAPPSILPAPVYAALTAIETANGYGFQRHFDTWQTEGLIN